MYNVMGGSGSGTGAAFAFKNAMHSTKLALQIGPSLAMLMLQVLVDASNSMMSARPTPGPR